MRRKGEGTGSKGADFPDLAPPPGHKSEVPRWRVPPSRPLSHNDR